jgi:hypothetical protein
MAVRFGKEIHYVVRKEAMLAKTGAVVTIRLAKKGG